MTETRAVSPNVSAGANSGPDERVPALSELHGSSRNRIRRFIITSALSGGATGEHVAGLYADTSDDRRAGTYLDYRFLLRRIPPDWRAVEDTALDLAQCAHDRGVELAAAWSRANEIARDQPEEDPLDVLARLAGAELGRHPGRSIFDDPQGFDEDEHPDDASRHAAFATGRSPGLHDLSESARESISRFILEERLEHGLPPVELMELYRSLNEAGDERASQYLDRVYEDGELPNDWASLQSQADELRALAGRRSKDAGRLFADARRRSVGVAAVDLLRIVKAELS